MKRGDIWWADLPPPAGPRPVVVLTRDQVVGTIDAVVVCIVTRTVRGIPIEVTLGRSEGLPVASVTNLDNLVTVSKQRLVRRMGQMGVEKTRVSLTRQSSSHFNSNEAVRSRASHHHWHGPPAHVRPAPRPGPGSTHLRGVFRRLRGRVSLCSSAGS